ncbi:MAG: RluA family pseudouridine synthase [Patescibacteria group bacterium]|nr:RluA family pseudouridine synthase [Patescibacteria group bacterium]
MAQAKPKIIWENKEMLALDKPAGLRIHDDGRERKKSELTLVDWLLKHNPGLESIGPPFPTDNGKTISRAGIAHRLDKDTSGIMLVAKEQAAFDQLQKQFQDYQVRKTYRLLVYGNIEGDNGIIDRPIGRSRHDPRRRVATKKAVGQLREASTAYHVLERFYKDEPYTYLEAAPRTGRTHQLRVHLQALGHPVVGDKLYAPGRSSPADLERQALHAYSLKFASSEGQTEELIAELPADFKAALDSLR